MTSRKESVSLRRPGIYKACLKEHESHKVSSEKGMKIESGKKPRTTGGVRRRELLSTPEAAEYLGITPSGLKHLRDHRLLSFIKPGHRTCRYDCKDLDAYLSRCRVQASWEKS